MGNESRRLAGGSFSFVLRNSRLVRLLKFPYDEHSHRFAHFTTVCSWIFALI